MKPCGSWLKSKRDLNADNRRPEAELGSALSTPGKKIQSKGEATTRELHPRLLLNPKVYHGSFLCAQNTPRARAEPYVRAALPGKAQHLF